jgi:PAS domain S-box-containing protein
MVGVTFDVTARKQAEAELRAREAELRLIGDHVPAKVAYTDAAQKFRYANAAFVEFFTGSTVRAEGKTLEEVLGSHNAPLARRLLARALAGESVHEVSARRRWDGIERMLDVTLVPNVGEAGNVVGAFVFLLDITERIDAEKGRLERARLEAANLELNAFAYTVAHDLSAPLRRITAFAHLLRESVGERLSEEGHHALAKIDASAHRLHELIAALLKYARSARADLRIVELDLSELVDEAVENLQPEYPRANIRVGTLPKVWGDRALMWDVFLNLLGNALKFSSKREKPIVEIGTMMTSRGEAVFVRDNGAGFDPAFGDKLFRVFHRLHKESEFPGTGIGLAFVHRVLQRHGVKIWAESMPDQGATFYFTLPFVPEPASSGAS